MYDVIIIGGGPAGMTAGIYAARRAIKTLILTKDIGGQISTTNEVENYPGIDHIGGLELGMSMYNQAKKFGAEIKFEGVDTLTIDENNEFIVKTPSQEYLAQTVILCSGKKPGELNIPGEKKLRGKGVTYCATCDAPFFKDKVVTVVGGGNSALDAALLMSKYASKVYLIHRRNEFRGEKVLIEKVQNEPKIETILEAEIVEIFGENKVESIKLLDNRSINCDGVIIEIGYIVDRTLVENLLELDSKNHIIVTPNQETSVPGIFAAGDITPTIYKQVVIAAGEGAKAALSSFDFIQHKLGKRGIAGDWH
ncbi:MAG: FAD-dependent oxidoreductase [bacterium]